MDDGPFHEPNVGLGRIYTRTGDAGDTSLVGGQRVPKDDPRIEAYGVVDELNACVGLARDAIRSAAAGDPALDGLVESLLRVQHQLFNLGSELSTVPGDIAPGQPVTTEAHVLALEQEMDRRNRDLPPLRSFVLPGGSPQNGLMHLCRTVCRRAERLVVRVHREGGCSATSLQYLNRLSDAFFVWSRWVAQHCGDGEVLWDPNKA